MHKSRLCSVRCAVLGRHKHIQVARKAKIDGQSLKRDLQSVDSSLTVQTRASAGGLLSALESRHRLTEGSEGVGDPF